jgi:hypothetical protein
LVLVVFGGLEKAHYCVLDGKVMYVGVWTFCMQIVCFFLCYSPERSCKIAVASPPFLFKFLFFSLLPCVCRCCSPLRYCKLGL